ncbi:cold shock domain-containing protein [Actinomadura fulvescens]|uniref:CSD domain-containing protein n=1 Tax=Actinomadura fulvescens TaxID=46160 RepID=A0ABP6CBV6_9ACTN
MNSGGEPVNGTVKSWHSAEGWGVLASPDVPGEVWAHFSAIWSKEPDTFRSLTPKERVVFTWEQAEQDGYAFSATEVRRPKDVNASTVWGAPQPNTLGGDGAYSSTLQISWDSE